MKQEKFRKEAEAMLRLAGLESRVDMAAALEVTPQAISQWLGGGNAGKPIISGFRRWLERQRGKPELVDELPPAERRAVLALRRLPDGLRERFVACWEAMIDGALIGVAPQRRVTPETPIPDLKKALDDSDEHHIDTVLLDPNFDADTTLPRGTRLPRKKRQTP